MTMARNKTTPNANINITRKTKADYAKEREEKQALMWENEAVALVKKYAKGGMDQVTAFQTAYKTVMRRHGLKKKW